MTLDTKKKLLIEMRRLAGNSDPRVQRLLKAMAERYPHLFSATSEPRPQFCERGERQA